MTRPSKSEQRARRIGKLILGCHDASWTRWLWTALLRVDRNLWLRCKGRTRAEAIRNVLRAADRLATRVERSRV